MDYTGIRIDCNAQVSPQPDEGAGWRVQYALFGRSGFTPAARAEMAKVSGFLIDLKALDDLLRKQSPPQ